ncbi:ATP-binding cassette sub-family A member 2-like [Wyeomyia smithii]|uniref:ATP-binding cassette sub-family A member 2-like n=1 Tax=Wyeomyia smithii TaxID=174621 RepID=UPI002467DF6C|nr:ATP-binding cassette sub-family A member 2-like [Wyeomyia smithii]
MTSSWNKFTLLLWKNSLIHRRHYIRSAFDILLPILFISMVLLIPVDELRQKFSQRIKLQDGVEFDVINYKFKSTGNKQTLLYYPQSNLVDEIVQEAALKLQIDNIEPVQSLKILKARLEQGNAEAGIAFKNKLQSVDRLPEKISYSISFPTIPSHFEEDPTEKSLAIQSAVSSALLRRLAPRVELPSISVKSFPFREHIAELREFVLVVFILLLLAFNPTCINTVKYITVEKERQLKEALKVMGLQSWIHWAAWFVEMLLMLTISVSVITYMFASSVMQRSNWMLIWIFLLTYSVALVCFSFLISVFFKKASIAAVAAGILFFASACAVSSSDSFQLRIASSLLFNTVFGYGLEAMLYHEFKVNGLIWSSFSAGTSFCKEYSLGTAVGMLLLDAVIYMIATLFIEQILPGEYGIPKPWYFPFTQSFWAQSGNKQVTVTLVEPSKSLYYEDDPRSARAGIQIRNLNKAYHRGKFVVDNLTLNMYENHITVLLGHNGAGKTTTISMLTGMLPASSGTALVNGYDIHHTEQVRTSLGFCPQHNVLIDELTVNEHLVFAARLRGVSREELFETVSSYVSLIGLKDERKARSSSLSGGMKRRLAIGMAFVGGPKVVLLDEPTAGVDPAARRSIWDFLLAQKNSRTILLSTHLMDEADILGDRIAIMAGGKLTAVGSPFFLKQLFGVGYRLICVKGPNARVDKVEKVLQSFLDDVKIDTETSTEVTFVLKSLANMEKLLIRLEAELETCGMKSYGIGLTTMEDVFLKAGSESIMLRSTGNSNQIDLPNKPTYITNQLRLLKGMRVTINQIRALFWKKWIYTKRCWFKHAVQILLPAALVALLLLNDQRTENSNASVNILENGITEQLVVDNYRKLLGNRRLLETQLNMKNFLSGKLQETNSLKENDLRIGATFAANYYTAWFNILDSTLATEALNQLYNAILYSECLPCRITGSLEMTKKPQEPIDIFLLNLAISFAIAFVSSMFIFFYIRERVCQVKLLQLLAGLSSGLYWIVNFFYDLLLFSLTIVLLISTLTFFNVPEWSESTNITLLSLVFFLYSWAFLSHTYLLSFWIDNPASGVTKLLLLYLFAGILVLLLMFVLISFQLDRSAEAAIGCLHLVPVFTLLKVLGKFGLREKMTESCSLECDLISECSPANMCSYLPLCCNDLLTLDDNGIVREMCYLLATGVLYWILIGCLEYKLHQRLQCRRSIRTMARELYNTDTDVLEEKLRVSRMSRDEISQHSVVVKNLSKRYGSNVAVKRLSVAVDAGECFGLLGVNGAGKTSTFKMLVGDESIMSGEIWINGVNIGNIRRIDVGYCPQFDGLLDEFTGMETLRIFALLRGIHDDDIEIVTFGLAEDLSFKAHLYERTKNYSGGNKRKLCTALALMSPSIILLDEPSAGLDPGARRRLWNVIMAVREAGRTIILTTHSMDECEALCTKLSVMVNGELRCLGSTQHLKNRFSQGFMINIKMDRDNSANLASTILDAKNFIKRRFPDAELREEHDEYLSFFIPLTQHKWSEMFGIMEAAKDSLSIEDYTLGQTTLEQVFLHFTRKAKPHRF